MSETAEAVKSRGYDNPLHNKYYRNMIMWIGKMNRTALFRRDWLEVIHNHYPPRDRGNLGPFCARERDREVGREVGGREGGRDFAPDQDLAPDRDLGSSSEAEAGS